VWGCWQLWTGLARGAAPATAGAPPPTLAEPHPALRFLCRVDAAATLGVLSSGLRGWDALESDLAEAVPEVAAAVGATGPLARTVTQAAVDAVVTLRRAGAFAAGGADAAALRFLIKSRGAKLVIVNREPTEMDDVADLAVHDSIGDVFGAAVEVSS
jgi:hypothetical protein